MPRPIAKGINSDLTKVWEAYQELNDLDLLEDRREYTVDDLKLGHDLTDSQAEYLHALIQQNFDPEADSLYHSQWSPEIALEFASLVSESIHQEFDGWEPHEKAVIVRYLHDLGVALKAVRTHYKI